MFAHLTLLAAVVALAHGQCTVNIKSQLHVEAPLFLRNNQLWAPDGGTLQWDAGEITLIACPQKLIENTGTEAANIQCVSGQTFNVGGANVDITNVFCTNRNTPMSSVQNTGQPCANGGTLLRIGFAVPNIPFVTYIESCYNMQTDSAIYSRHVIRGIAIKDKFVDKNRPSFKDGDIKTDFNSYYLQANQGPHFLKLLGPGGQKKYFHTGTKYLARGHLAPDADGIFRPWQRASYYFVNAVPIWQKVNNCNWKAVEYAAREIAEVLREDVLVFTGVHDIMTLPHDNGQPILIKLKADAIEVPKWIWKIIKLPRLNAAMVLITNNDPYREDALSTDELLCPDVCQQYGWSKPNYSDSERGYTYCCTVDSLLQVIPNIPNEAHSPNVLHFRTRN